MKKDLKKIINMNDHVGCFANFNFTDPVCKKYCALNVRCAIESDQKERMEILEDLVSTDFQYLKIQ